MKPVKVSAEKKIHLFGDRASDWTCPLCQYKPKTPLIACPECGCHILLCVKIKRAADELTQQGQEISAQALFKAKNLPS